MEARAKARRELRRTEGKGLIIVDYLQLMQPPSTRRDGNRAVEVGEISRSMDETEAESEDRPDLGTAQLIVAKHRNGPTRDIDLAFNPEYTRFMDFIDDSRAGGF